MGSGGSLTEESARIPAPSRLDLPHSDPLALRLFPPLPESAEWETGRVRAALRELDDPQRAYATLHVGGTNGKGSVAAVWASVLAEGGHRVGLYTSPHLVTVAERFRVGGRPADEAHLLDASREIESTIVSHGLTFFEAATVLALHLFRRDGVDVAVVEVGLGGRLDATNVILPRVTAVTNVALDHEEFLGSSLEQIAYEKAGIAKSDVPFVTSESAPGVRETLREAVEARGGRFHALDASELHGIETSLGGSRFELDTAAWGRLSLASPMIGRHQITNIALAVRALELLEPPLRPDTTDVMRGVANARWPGRFQVERIDERTWIFDVAHNPAGAHALAGTLGQLEMPGPRVLVAGILKDKDWRSMLRPLMRQVECAILTRPPGAPEHRQWDPEGVVRQLASLHAVAVPDFETALGEARSRSVPNGTVVVAGSHFTVGAALAGR